jgi:hypothetical protein
LANTFLAADTILNAGATFRSIAGAARSVWEASNHTSSALDWPAVSNEEDDTSRAKQLTDERFAKQNVDTFGSKYGQVPRAQFGAIDDPSLYAYAGSGPTSNVDITGLLVLLGPGGGGRVFGVICGDYGFRMDYAPNPSPTLLHFHFGPLSAGGSWGGHRPWYAPWQVY